MTQDEIKRLTRIIRGANSATLSHTTALFPGKIIGHQSSLPVIVINHPLFDAWVLLQSAQLIRFAPKGDTGWLWISPPTHFVKGQPIPCGLVICLPGPLQDDKPASDSQQGDWCLTSLKSTADQVKLVFNYTPRHAAPNQQVTDFDADIVVILSEHITIQLNFTNLSCKTQSYSYRLNGYFAVDDITRVIIRGLDNTSYLDNLDQRKEKHQTGDLVPTGAINRLFPATRAIQYIHADTSLRLSSNSPSRTVWCSEQNKELYINNIKNYCRHFIGFGCCAIPENPRRLQPGKSFSTELTIERHENSQH